VVHLISGGLCRREQQPIAIRAEKRYRHPGPNSVPAAGSAYRPARNRETPDSAGSKYSPLGLRENSAEEDWALPWMEMCGFSIPRRAEKPIPAQEDLLGKNLDFFRSLYKLLFFYSL
jgi:hypothetical protein